MPSIPLWCSCSVRSWDSRNNSSLLSLGRASSLLQTLMSFFEAWSIQRRRTSCCLPVCVILDSLNVPSTESASGVTYTLPVHPEISASFLESVLVMQGSQVVFHHDLAVAILCTEEPGARGLCAAWCHCILHLCPFWGLASASLEPVETSRCWQVDFICLVRVLWCGLVDLCLLRH